ncbi:MAG: PAS domain S-box protein, partial [Thioalkalivibrio sp.]|nr:PAS domain S-box protein [Thioalkalivibrio sp.]
MTPATGAPRRERLPRMRGVSRYAWWAGCAYAAILVAAYSFRTAVPALELFAKYLQYLPLTLGAGMALTIAARRPTLLPGTRSALRWLGAGMFGSALGMVWYIYVHEVVAAPKGMPRLGDAAFLLSYVAIVVGLTRLPRRSPGQYEVWKVVLDAAVVAVGIGLVGWHLIIAPTTVAIEGPLDLFIRVAYPVLDIAFLFALNSVIVGGGPAEHRRAFGWIVVAILAYIVAESMYQVIYYGQGTPLAAVERTSEAFFTLAYLAFLGAGLSYRSYRESVAKPQYAFVAATSPLPLFATAAVALLVTRAAIDPTTVQEASLVLGLVALSVVLLVRQGLTATQNVGLLRDEAKRKGDTRVAALVRHASDLILVSEPDGTIRFASPSSQRILGVAPEQLVHRSIAAVVHPDDHALLPMVTNEANGARVTTPLRLQAADGGWVEFDVVVTDLTDEPAVGGLIFVARDLTERNALELRLRQSQKMEAVGRLAGGVAHDFNNLLTTILASTDLLLERELAADLRDDLEIVRQAAGRAAGLTGQLLAFSRQERLQRRPIDLVGLADETVSLLRRLLESEVSVRMEHDQQTLPIEGDANQLAQVIVNLALNARDAMPKGGTLTIRTAQRTTISDIEIVGGMLPAGSYG